jgi:4-hydroxythreonine-4-phosphate dehydrogenase
MTKRFIITPGEPAGVGPELCLQLLAQDWPCQLIVCADPALLHARAKLLSLDVKIREVDEQALLRAHRGNEVLVCPERLQVPSRPGQLNSDNASYVLKTLKKASAWCMQPHTDGLVTGPVNKEVINKAGFHFQGHTEFLRDHTRSKATLMVFVNQQFRLALATTHIPLKEASTQLTSSHLRGVIKQLHQGLVEVFHIPEPSIVVCGLNPHAGEGGILGLEEEQLIKPLMSQLQAEGFRLQGPTSADTVFLSQADAILSMYHDQCLGMIKYSDFYKTVNITLGLPYIRCSVDHGTALDLAGTGAARVDNLRAALLMASCLRESVLPLRA